jgi:mannose-6-phosphate isomerase
MTIEQACMRAVRKPWGSTDLRPWNEIRNSDTAIGELWFQRIERDAPDPALLLKLLFTQEPLSIQVHPDDAFAQSAGLGHGKTEAWYILSAQPGAQVAVGLKRELSAQQLRKAIEDGSISQLVQWHEVAENDVIYVPAGTIHAIGSGLVVAEIQQRSDVTFRLFDHGRDRELHVDSAVAVARRGPAACRSAAKRLSDGRTLLVASPQFILERIDFAPGSSWQLRATRETWVLVLDGSARIGLIEGHVGQAFFIDDADTLIDVGSGGLKALVAYPGPEPDTELLVNCDRTADLPARHRALPHAASQSAAGLPATSSEPRP